MPSFLEKEQLLPVQPVIAPADQILGAFNTRQSLFGIGASQVKSAASSYNQMQLSNPQNQQQLDGLLQQSNKDLKSASLRDLSVGDNQQQALSVFDPILKDQDIMGDHALTQSWGNARSQAESSRMTNGGKGYNSDAVRAINNQQAWFARSDKSSWRQFYNAKETYSPYYDQQAETEKLEKGFKTDVIQKEEQNGAYIVTTKNSSWYKDKWQQYFEANASPQLKAQVATKARADYYQNVLTMPKDKLVQTYTDQRNDILDKQIATYSGNIANIGVQLATTLRTKDNAELIGELTSQGTYLSTQLAKTQQRRSTPLEQAEALGDPNSIAIGANIAEGLGQYQYFDKIGTAFAHKELVQTLKPDLARLQIMHMNLQSQEFGITARETNRHNQATEGIQSYTAQSGRITATAAMLTAEKRKDADGEGGTTGNENGNFTNVPYGQDRGFLNSNQVNPKSDPVKDQEQGQTIMKHLIDNHEQTTAIFDGVTTEVFSQNLMGTIDKLIADPVRQNMTLADVPDPSKAIDGTGGNSARIAKFIYASGVLNLTNDPLDPTGGVGIGTSIRSEQDVYKLPLSKIKELTQKIWSDKPMFAAGLEAIKGNNATADSYAIASTLEINKQKLDNNRTELINQAIPKLKTNLGQYAPLFAEQLNKGQIPTLDDIKAAVATAPNAMLVAQGLNPWDAIKSLGIGALSIKQDKMTDEIQKTILGTLGNNRTAYNTKIETFEPDKLDPKKDANFRTNMQILFNGAESATKGNGGDKVTRIIDYARRFPELVKGVTVHSVDEAHDMPYFTVNFKTPTTAEEKADPHPTSDGIEISTTTAHPRFQSVPLDDRTTLLNNRALKFETKYKDGYKSNLSIYNKSGDQTNPDYDINPDFSYKYLDIDPKTGDIKGTAVRYKDDEVSSLLRSFPNRTISQVINDNPTYVHETLAKKVIMQRDAVNYAQQNKITNIKDLPQYLKDVLFKSPQ